MKYFRNLLLFLFLFPMVSCKYFKSENEFDQNYDKLRMLYRYDMQPNSSRELNKINDFYFFIRDDNPEIQSFFLLIAAEKFVNEESIIRSDRMKIVKTTNLQRLKYNKTYRKYAKRLLKDISIILRYRNDNSTKNSYYELTGDAVYAAGLIGHWDLAPDIYENMADILISGDDHLVEAVLEAISINGMNTKEVTDALNYLEQYRPEMRPKVKICFDSIH